MAAGPCRGGQDPDADAETDDVAPVAFEAEEIYRLAYRLNCKGVTVYRDGSREMQVLSSGATAKKVREKVGEGGKGGEGAANSFRSVRLAIRVSPARRCGSTLRARCLSCFSVTACIRTEKAMLGHCAEESLQSSLVQ